MVQIDRTPIYNLKAVVRQTGLKPDTLRAWERRYGLPNPQRTDSGHRLYSQYDVEIIKWLTERQNEGLSIGRAIDLWNQLEQDQASDPLENGYASRAAAPSVATATSIGSGEMAENHVDQLRQHWIDSVLNFDEQAAEAVLSQAFSLFPTETVCMRILQGGLAEIGRGWHEGRVTVQQEHFASALAIRRLEALLTGMPAPTRPGRVIIGCPADEEHIFIPLMLAVLLRRHGFDVVYLGANIPLRSMAPTINSTAPQLVILTAQQLFTAASLMETALLLEQEGIAMAYGGLIFRRMPQLTKVIPGHYLGDDIETSLQAIEQVLVAPRVKSASIAVTQEYQIAHDHFRQHQSEIEAGIWQRLSEWDVPPRQLDTANHYMGRNIRAALQLGNMDYIGLDLVWIEELLVQYYEMPQAMVRRYLQIYHESALEQLDERGAIVVDWFGKLLGLENEQGAAGGSPPSMSDLFGRHLVSAANI